MRCACDREISPTRGESPPSVERCVSHSHTRHTRQTGPPPRNYDTSADASARTVTPAADSHIAPHSYRLCSFTSPSHSPRTPMRTPLSALRRRAHRVESRPWSRDAAHARVYASHANNNTPPRLGSRPLPLALLAKRTRAAWPRSRGPAGSRFATSCRPRSEERSEEALCLLVVPKSSLAATRVLPQAVRPRCVRHHPR